MSDRWARWWYDYRRAVIVFSIMYGIVAAIILGVLLLNHDEGMRKLREAALSVGIVLAFCVPLIIYLNRRDGG